MDGFGLLKRKKFPQTMVKRYNAMLDEDYQTHKITLCAYSHNILIFCRNKLDNNKQHKNNLK